MNNTEVFNQVYRSGEWYYGSGTGSIAVFNQPFIRLANDFIASHPDIRTVVDIGCGDWQIGRNLRLEGLEYVGCDVSSFILEKTRARYEGPHRKFLVLDAINEPLPEGDLVIVKDVLQHLSNADAARVLEKVGKFRYAIIQNDIHDDGAPNTDIRNGEWRELDVTMPPFSKSEYRRARTYTEGLLIPVNLLRRLTGRKPIRKGVFVKG